MRIVLRFLKETGLLPLWSEYVYKGIKSEKQFYRQHWSNVRYVDDVLGNTSFTKFVVDKLSKKDGVTYSLGIPICHRFAYWIKKIGLYENYIDPRVLKYLSNVGDKEMCNQIVINPITKKAQLIFNKII